ncbi:DddA-like double-stranded DNA deaminase toxin [Amycolatopsis magusensis]|uniref:DddA-like double-stranded DNA deaminase toxin n=1 Tax=Amycolatopsis magusensis TaxID=882444 RepID=UPI0037BB1722
MADPRTYDRPASDLEDVAGQVATGLARAASAGKPLADARAHLEEAIVAFKTATSGSQAPEIGQALGALREALQNVVTLEELINAATGKVKPYASSQLAVAPTPAPTTRDSGSASAPTAPKPDPDTTAIERLRQQLPPPVVPGRRGPGQPQQKTHGRWVDANGQEHQMVSGQDDAYNQTVDYFKTIGSRHVPQRASDVEMKLAVHMRQNGITDATLVINNRPCVGPMGCDALVPVLLPKGSKMRVYGVNGFVKTYEGGGTSSWVP